MNIFDTFLNFSGLKSDKSKCEIAGIARKLHMMHSHLDFFKSSMGNYSKEHGECFHQDVMEFEKGYQGECNERMMGDYVWGLVRETQTLHQRKSRKFVFSINSLIEYVVCYILLLISISLYISTLLYSFSNVQRHFSAIFLCKYTVFYFSKNRCHFLNNN